MEIDKKTPLIFWGNPCTKINTCTTGIDHSMKQQPNTTTGQTIWKAFERTLTATLESRIPGACVLDELGACQV